MLKELNERPRRLRSSSVLRDLVSEKSLDLSKLIQPYFIKNQPQAEEPIPNFTGQSRWGIEKLLKRVEADRERGVKSFLLFGEVEPAQKDARGSAAIAEKSLVAEAVRALKKNFGKDIVLFTDVCLCPSTDHGHCGVLDEGEVDNDPSLDLLAMMAMSHADAGADFVAPSDMMDGRVGAIRRALDGRGHTNVGILAYSAKYASAYYGPFREALGSSPSAKGKQGPEDRTSYQMDYRNEQEAMRELRLDVAEGADMVMVKPALAYLDIIAKFKQATDVPVVAYSVSGEFEMVKQMAKAGLADERRLAIENLTAIRRAGADIIITYFATEFAQKGWL